MLLMEKLRFQLMKLVS